MSNELNTSELSQVTGGVLVFDNMQKGAARLGSRWDREVSRKIGGPIGQFAGGFAGLGGAILGTVGGFTHTLGLNREPY